VSAQGDEAMTRRGGWFEAVAGLIGDLGHPFYEEERQRDVWNEASAVGLQLTLWLGFAVATAMVWLGGAPALPYAATVVVVLGVAGGVTVLYASRLGVRLDDPRGILRLRLIPYAGLLLAYFVGVMRAAPSDGFFGGFVEGMVLGSALAVAWLVGGALRARRREARDGLEAR
jgi:hypothetical protein